MRYFTIHHISLKKYEAKIGGRYVNKTPLNAAKKAFNHILRDNKTKQISFAIEIRETTKNSNYEIYKYVLTRKLKKTPITVNKDGKNIVYHYDVFSKELPKEETKKEKTSPKYKCTDQEKTDKLTSVCCSTLNSLNKRAYTSCKKHILRNIQK